MVQAAVAVNPSSVNQPRIFECLMAFVMFTIGVQMFVFSSALLTSHMRMIVHTIPPWMFACACIAVGAFRITVIVGNGRFGGRSVPLRIAATIASAIMWAEMVYAFAARIITEGAAVPPGLTMLTGQLFGELWLVWKLCSGRR